MGRWRSAAAVARLARWLGPWTPDDRVPPAVDRRTVAVTPSRAGERPFDAWLYRPMRRAPMGSLLLVPGLHYAGPADPRLDRFASVLADAGLLVLAPFLPDFARLRVEPGLLGDTERAFEALLRLPERPTGSKPGVFSISFGSLPALRLAASPRLRDEVGGLVVFGGFADFGDTIRFSLHGDGDRPHDPLNRPVVFLNLIDHLEGVPGDPAPLMEAWSDYVRATWGRPEMKERPRHGAVASEIAARLDPTARHLFLLGCGLEAGTSEACERALARASDAHAHAWLDPRPHLQDLRCPVYLVHGRDDDVIPHTQATLLRQAMPPHLPVRLHVTGLYAHTGKTGLADLLSRIPEAARELAAMVGILRAITAAATGR